MTALIIGPVDLQVEGVQTQVRLCGVKLDQIVRPEQEEEISPRENLIVYLNAAVEAIDPTGRQHGLPLLRVLMPCGNFKEYQTENNIPVTSDSCSCKHPKHCYIQYTDAEGNPIVPAPKPAQKAAPKPKAKKS